MDNFILKSSFKPSGSQPLAIDKLVEGLEYGLKHQTLLGVTGSGKTFTIANVIERMQRPTLIIAPNKTLAAQLTAELRSFFPDNAVEYFVSYYDYYQPEAYVVDTDTYIEKEVEINDQINQLRHRSTCSILKRRDTIIVASVSAIYNLGSPQNYQNEVLHLGVAEVVSRETIIRRLVDLYYNRSRVFSRGAFDVRGSIIDVVPPAEEKIYRLILDNERLDKIEILDLLTKKFLGTTDQIFIFPAKHFVIDSRQLKVALANIRKELSERLLELRSQNKIIEAERLERRTNHDLTMIGEIGYCNGIENYSRHLAQRLAGSPPETLLDYFPKDFLTIIDESHITIPQIQGMFAGDRARKQTLINYGFRLPSALDNRPLTFAEFDERTVTRIYLSATPGTYEKQIGQQIVEQIIRPTGLVDPRVEIKPLVNQVEDAIDEIAQETRQGNRVLVTTLTKKMAEDLAGYLKEKNLAAEFLHSEVDTLERIRILNRLKTGKISVLVGVNLLREGLDLPEVALVLILDADKEGFLRSQTSLIQTMGRAARNVHGRVILYADNITKSMSAALEEANRRRSLQLEYNRINHITPKTIKRNVKSLIKDERQQKEVIKDLENVDFTQLPKMIKSQEQLMKQLAADLKFEEAALVRDEILAMKKLVRKMDYSR